MPVCFNGCSRPNNSSIKPIDQTTRLGIVGNIEFDFARYLENSFWMLAILPECILERLLPAREQATENTVLFADDPVSKTILANKDDRPGGAKIFDKLHDYSS
ncbi:hypothetical protein ACVWZK_008391 [Bradyrhizobium sp. GM0.4]